MRIGCSYEQVYYVMRGTVETVGELEYELCLPKKKM